MRQNNGIVCAFENVAILCFVTHPSKCCPDRQSILETECTDKMDISGPKELRPQVVVASRGQKQTFKYEEIYSAVDL